MHPLFADLLGVVHPWVGHLQTHHLVQTARHRVRGVYPAPGVDHVHGQVTVVHALYGAADELTGREDQAARHQEGGGHSIVKTEHGRVCVDAT